MYNTEVVIGMDYVQELFDMSMNNLMNSNSDLINGGKIKLIQGNGWQGYTEFAAQGAIHVGARRIANEELSRQPLN